MSQALSNRLLFSLVGVVAVVSVYWGLSSHFNIGVPDASAMSAGISTPMDAGPVAAPVAPPPVLPDPLDRPVEFVEQLEPIRTNGGLYVVVLVVLGALARTISTRLRPSDGAPPPTGWRERAITVLSTVAVLVAGLIDLITGSLTGLGFGVVAAGGALALRDPRDKTKADGKSARSLVPPLSAALLVVALLMTTSCATVRHSGAAGAEAGLDCSAPALRATVDEAALLAKAFVLSKISGTGEVDSEALRAAARSLKSEAMRCGLVAAIAAVAAAMEPQPSAKLLMAQPAAVDLRALARDIATVEWGIVGPVIVEGSEI